MPTPLPPPELSVSAPLVSVIMPVHNAAPYLGAAIRSVLAQRLSNLELILVDDASTDGSGEVARGFSDPRLRFLRSETPLNAAGARNLALAEARGEFIAFLDADDIAAPHWLEQQIDFLRREPRVGLIASRLRLIDEVNRPCGSAFRQRSADEVPATLLFENCLPLSSSTVRRSLVEPFRPEFAPAEDYELWTRLTAKSGLAVGGRPLVRYRVHAASVSARQPEQMRAAVAAIHALQLDRLGFRQAPAIHAQLAAWPLAPTMGAVAEAEAWLLALSAANDRRGCYARDPFRRVLAARWYSTCLDSWQLGWPVWNVYHHSPLAAPTVAGRLRLLRRLLPQRLRARRQP